MSRWAATVLNLRTAEPIPTWGARGSPGLCMAPKEWVKGKGKGKGWGDVDTGQSASPDAELTRT